MAATSSSPGETTSVKGLAVVTGGGSGIGRALAHVLALRGVEVIVVGRRSGALQATCDTARGGSPVHACVADVATAEGRDAIASAVAAHGPNLRLLVHNAAILKIGSLADLPETDWEAAMRVNVTAPLLLTRRLLSAMQPGTRVLHISSGAAHAAFGGMGSYCATKAALLQLCRAWRADRAIQLAADDAAESAPETSAAAKAASLSGIRFGSARPGIVDTAMQVQGREADPTVFASAAMFREWKERGDAIRAAAGDAVEEGDGAARTWVAPPEGGLDTPDNCGRFLAWLLLDVGEEEYEAKDDWDIRTTTPPPSLA